MKLEINESIQLIHLDGKKPITNAIIKRALVMARFNKDYAKFFLDKWYITVNYNKDNTVSFSHNIRSNEFQRALSILERGGYDIDKYAQFISIWLNKIRISPYFANVKL